jgi:hypothetical protein
MLPFEGSVDARMGERTGSGRESRGTPPYICRVLY